MLLMVQPAARSEDPVDLDPLLEVPIIAQADEQALVAGGGAWTLDAYDDCHPADPTKITHADVVYKHLDGANLDLFLDEYDPPVLDQVAYPALILVHGGGGVRGCKWNEQIHAIDLTMDPSSKFTQHFIVLAIDYRLGCDPNDPNLAGSSILRYCGWSYNRSDAAADRFDGYQYGPGIHDVEWAIDYAWHHAGDFCHCWNNKVAIIGGSWGGNLAFMASQRIGTGAADQVNALGAWSGGLEVQQQHGPNPDPTQNAWPCYPFQTNDAFNCQRGTNMYLGCAISPYPGATCQSQPPQPPPPPPPPQPWQGWYSDASPYGFFGYPTPTGWPSKVFFANGGGTGQPELQSLQSATDFANWLTSRGWFAETSFKFCTVDAPKHAERYLNDSVCHGESQGLTVFQRTVAFITSAVA